MYRIGIDLGGTNIAAGLVDKDLNLLWQDSVPTGADRAPELIMDDMAALCKKLCADHNIALADIESIGIASPGIANHDTGVVEYANNLPFRQFPIAQMLRDRLGVERIRLENDANAAAWGEAVAGAAKGTTNSVMITLGTGVGGGIIIDNKVYSGFNYAGAELGHIVIEVNGAQCSCGRKGCWEAYSSATGLIRMTKEKIAECEKAGRPTLMKTLAEERGKVSGRTAFDAKRAGDAAADEVVDKYVLYLAEGLSNIINIFQPEVISIGGGISNEGDYLKNLLIPKIKERVYGGEFVPATKICMAELGNSAGIIGAAML
ncbi:MAG: ROK family protein [Clostridia bacterium]|nr:ROK family protein [Clostridia bacterium]